MDSNITVISEKLLGDIGGHGLDVLRSITTTSPIHVLVGTSEHPTIARMMETGSLPLKPVTEAFAIAPMADGRWVIAGFDEKGLMYGCQEAADQMNAFGTLKAVNRSPFVKVRGLYDFMHNKDNDSGWFYSKEYWVNFFNEMAANRYNSFNLVFSHQTYYLAPMFAYFLDMPEFPEVTVQDADAAQIQKNHDMLQFISKQAERRGVDFILGMWQMCSWKGNENDWRPVQEGMVRGLNAANHENYIYTGMKKIIAQFPAIKGLQIRANEESGIPKARQTEFFKNSLFKAMHEADRPFLFDFRLWLAERETVDAALELVPGTRWSCKYWGEFMGAPYQPAKISPGYSYSDFLRQPLKVDFIYQVWSLGSPRLLLWGDPDYVRRFVRSTTLGGGCGFELNLHLTQKGYGNEPGAWRIFKNPEDEYYTHEIERYWLFNRLFGRLGYDPDARSEEWMLPMRKRFGDDAGKVMNLYSAGSDILTFLVQYTLSDPNMYIWPEIDIGGMLDFYIQTPSSDSCTIATVPEYVKFLLDGTPLGKFSPLESAAHFTDKARRTFACIEELEATTNKSNELRSTILDFRILAYLAMYHAEKIHAAIGLELYYKTHDVSALKECYVHIHKATQCWEQLVHATQNTYYNMMVTGPNDAGDWKRKMIFVYEDELRVSELLNMAKKFGTARLGLDFGHQFSYPAKIHTYTFLVNHDNSLERNYHLVSDETNYAPEKGYGWISHGQLTVSHAPDYRINDTQLDPLRRDCFVRNKAETMKGWRNPLLEDGIGGCEPATLKVDLPDGEYDITVLVCDQSPCAKTHGPMSVMIGKQLFTDVRVQPLEEVKLTARCIVQDSAVQISLSGNWFISGVLVHDVTPSVCMVPVRTMTHGKPLNLSATVNAPDGVAKVILTLTAGNEHIAVDMARQDDNIYKAALPECVAKGCEYMVIAIDNFGRSTTSQVTSLKPVAECGGISINHQPITNCKVGTGIKIALKANSMRPLTEVSLHYSYLNQFMPVETIDMVCEGDSYEATIPGDWIDPLWQILYYFELVDEAGQGAILPDFRKQTPYYVIEVEA